MREVGLLSKIHLRLGLMYSFRLVYLTLTNFLSTRITSRPRLLYTGLNRRRYRIRSTHLVLLLRFLLLRLNLLLCLLRLRRLRVLLFRLRLLLRRRRLLFLLRSLRLLVYLLPYLRVFIFFHTRPKRNLTRLFVIRRSLRFLL